MSEIKDRIILTFLVISYMMQTEIITAALKLFICSNLSTDDDPEYYLDANPDIQCYQGTHLTWALLFGLPIFLIWGIILPVTLYKKAKKAKDLPYKRIRYLFIFSGMREEKYYWEFVILLRKQLMVLILVFLGGARAGGQVLISFIVILSFTLVHF